MAELVGGSRWFGTVDRAERKPPVCLRLLACPLFASRANLSDGPETRRYRARYLKKDQPTGEFSDVLVVTVPARA